MFNFKPQHAAALVIALATLTACDSEPTAPNADPSLRAASAMTTPSGNIISHQEGTVPFSFGVYAPCANGGQGEVLSGNGELQYKAHFVTTTQGQRQHNATVAGFTGIATGWDSGEVYDIATHEIYQSNIDYGNDGIPDSGEQLERIAARMKSRATGAVIDIVLTGRFVQNANGEWVVDGWSGTARCK